MIVVRTPYRVSLVGGGTDLPAVTRQLGEGNVVSFTPKLFMHTMVQPTPSEHIRVSYSITETVPSTSEGLESLKHEIIRAALYHFDRQQLEISTIGDIPGGSGLGSSAACSIGIIHAMESMRTSPKNCTPDKLFRWATELEMNALGRRIGYQDQCASAYGGLNHMTFTKDGLKSIYTLPCKLMRVFLEQAFLAPTGEHRDAEKVLADQTKVIDTKKYAQLSRLAVRTARLFTAGTSDPDLLIELIDLINESWQIKRAFPGGTSDRAEEVLGNVGTDERLLGGKLLGAGSGGYMLLILKTHIDREKFKTDYRIKTLIPLVYHSRGSEVILKT